MKLTRKKVLPKRKYSPPKLVDTVDLCKELVAMAAFSLSDNPRAQAKIYKTVRQLQLLDKLAAEAGVLPKKALTARLGNRHED